MDSGESNDYTDQRRPAFSMMNSLRTVTGLIRLSNRMPNNKKQQKQQVAQRKQKTTARSNSRQVGAAFVSRWPKIGLTDIKNHKLSWILGYVFVGDGTNGTADNVFFQTAAGTYLMGTAATAGTRGHVPILASDTQIGQTYCSDVEKHFARKRINSMKLHVVSLQPATSNNMMCVVAPSRGSSLAETSQCSPLATAANVQQIFSNVMSMDDALPVDCFETKSMDITRYIAGGSGAKQNEFDIANNAVNTTVFVSGSYPAQDLDGLAPASIIVSGNSTTTGLRNTKTHAIIIEQSIDLLDFVGGASSPYPVGLNAPAAPSSSSSSSTEAQELARRVLGF